MCLPRSSGPVCRILTMSQRSIEVGEIEENLSSRLNPAIARSIVDKVESDALGTALVAFLELSPNYTDRHGDVHTSSRDPQHYHSAGGVSVLPLTTSADFVALVNDLKAKLAERLPAYMVPRHWLAVSRIPTQGMGKADRKTLRGLAETWDWRAASRSQRNGMNEGTSITADEEKRFTHSQHHEAARRAWAQVLRLPDDPDGKNIADEDSFMRLGGDSIRFMKLVSVLRGAGYSKIAFRDIVEATTLSACAAALAKTAATKGHGATMSYQPFELIPPEQRAELLHELATASLTEERLADVYPTAPSQDALIAPSFDSDRAHYYAQAVYPVNAPATELSDDQLQDAIRRLVERHETLRGVFFISETLGRTVSVILKSGDQEVQERSALQRIDVDSSDDLDSEITVRSLSRCL